MRPPLIFDEVHSTVIETEMTTRTWKNETIGKKHRTFQKFQTYSILHMVVDVDGEL